MLRSCFQLQPSSARNDSLHGCSMSYTVRPGDTCDTIAQSQRTNTTTIMSLNPLVNSGCTNLNVSQVLCVASAGTAGGTNTSGAVVGRFFWGGQAGSNPAGLNVGIAFSGSADPNTALLDIGAPGDGAMATARSIPDEVQKFVSLGGRNGSFSPTSDPGYFTAQTIAISSARSPEAHSQATVASALT